MAMSTPTFRRRRGRAAAFAVGLGIAVAGSLVGQSVGATPIVPGPTQVSGTVKTAAGDPIANACVYPIAEGQYTYVSGGTPGNLSQLLPGMCTGTDGKYTVTIPPGGTQTKSISGLAVAPDYSYVGEIWPATKGTDITLRPADGQVYGQLTADSPAGVVPVGNSVVEVFDTTTSTILGVAVTDSVNGYYLMGTAAAPNVTDTAVLGAGLQPGVATGLDVSPAIPFATPTTGSYLTPDPILLPSSTTITGKVTIDGATGLAYQVISALCQSGCSSSTYSLTDATGAFTIVVPRNSKVQLSAGGKIVPVNTAGFTYAVPSIRLVPKGASVGAYEGNPTTWLTPSGVTLKAKATWSWSGGSLVSGPDGWTREIATSTWKSQLSKFGAPAGSIDQSASAMLKPGASQCLRITTLASDAAPLANFTDAGTTSCQTLPLDDRSLKASAAWKKYKNAKAYAGTLATASAAKSTLTLSGVTGHGVGVVWSRTKAGGAFTISVNGKVLKSVSTNGAAASQRLTKISTKVLKGAKVVITTTSARPVSIDGLAVLP